MPMTVPPDGSTPASHEGPEPAKPLPGAYAFVGMGTSAAGCVAVGVGLGVALDHWLGTSPLFLLVGLTIGLVAAVASVVAQIRRFL
jgi:ATP synthase protein I